MSMDDNVTAWPLQWPLGWPRTARRQRAQFKTSLAGARDGLIEELRLMGVPRHRIVLSTNIPLRCDGLPYAGKTRPDDPAVAVYFLRDGAQTCIPCDRWDRVEDNVQAIRKTVEALRGLDRWGAKHMVEAAFAGFAALPATSGMAGWWTVIGVSRDAPLDDVQRAYRARLRETHPDTGGDAEAFHRVQEAWAQFTTERRKR